MPDKFGEVATCKVGGPGHRDGAARLLGAVSAGPGPDRRTRLDRLPACKGLHLRSHRIPRARARQLDRRHLPGGLERFKQISGLYLRRFFISARKRQDRMGYGVTSCDVYRWDFLNDLHEKVTGTFIACPPNGNDASFDDVYSSDTTPSKKNASQSKFLEEKSDPAGSSAILGIFLLEDANLVPHW